SRSGPIVNNPYQLYLILTGAMSPGEPTRGSQAKFLPEPELKPEEQALVGIGERDAGDLLGAYEPVTARVGMHIQAASRFRDVAVGVQVGKQGARVGGAVLGVVGPQGGPGPLLQSGCPGEGLGEFGQRRAGPYLFDGGYQRLARLARLASLAGQ